MALPRWIEEGRDRTEGQSLFEKRLIAHIEELRGMLEARSPSAPCEPGCSEPGCASAIILNRQEPPEVI